MKARESGSKALTLFSWDSALLDEAAWRQEAVP